VNLANRRPSALGVQFAVWDSLAQIAEALNPHLNAVEMLVHWKHEACCCFRQLGKSLVAPGTGVGLGCACMMQTIKPGCLTGVSVFVPNGAVA